MSDIPLYTPWIVCAANKHPTTGRIVCGARHYDTLMRAQIYAAEGSDVWKGCEQGFIDQRGRFWTREEAWGIAETNKQIRKRVGVEGTLFSENLY